MRVLENERVEELAQRLRRFHGVELDQVLEVIDYLRDEGDSVLVGGSLAYGLGNERSDLDIVVAAPADGESSSRMPLEHFIGSLRVDVWKLRANELEELFGRARQGLESEAPFEGAFGDVFEQADLKLLHRVAYGVVIDGPPVLGGGGGGNVEIARDLLVREYAERMRHSIFVAQLAIGAGRGKAGMINARFAIEQALTALVSARGLPFSDNKWLQVRLASEASDLRGLYEAFAVLPESDEEAARFVERAVATAQELCGLDLSVAALAADAGWECDRLRLFAAGDLRVLVGAEDDVVFELTGEEAEAWAALGSESRAGCAECGPVQGAIFFGLYAQGMARLRWARGLPLAELSIGGEGRDGRG